MSTDRPDDKDDFVVELKGRRLLEIVKAIVQAGAEEESAIVKEFGDVAVTLSLRDAEAIKSFIMRPGRAAVESTMDTLRTAMPQDFDHCERRRRP